MDIGKVHLDKRDGDPKQRVPQGDTGMGKGGWVKNNKLNVFFKSLVNTFDEFVFSIALQGILAEA